MKKLFKRSIALMLVMMLALSSLTVFAAPPPPGTVVVGVSATAVDGAPPGYQFVDVQANLTGNPQIGGGTIYFTATSIN